MLAALVALPLVRWILRPVDDLDAAAHEIAAGPPRRAGAEPRRPGRAARARRRRSTPWPTACHAALEQQRVFVSDASHQLRNPLAALRLRVENLRSHVDGDGRVDLREALAETERLAGLVDALLRLARAEATRVEHAPVDLGACVHERVERWAPLARDTPVTRGRAGAARWCGPAATSWSRSSTCCWTTR